MEKITGFFSGLCTHVPNNQPCWHHCCWWEPGEGSLAFGAAATHYRAGGEACWIVPVLMEVDGSPLQLQLIFQGSSWCDKIEGWAVHSNELHCDLSSQDIAQLPGGQAFLGACWRCSGYKRSHILPHSIQLLRLDGHTSVHGKEISSPMASHYESLQCAGNGCFHSNRSRKIFATSDLCKKHDWALLSLLLVKPWDWQLVSRAHSGLFPAKRRIWLP